MNEHACIGRGEGYIFGIETLMLWSVYVSSVNGKLIVKLIEDNEQYLETLKAARMNDIDIHFFKAATKEEAEQKFTSASTNNEKKEKQDMPKKQDTPEADIKIQTETQPALTPAAEPAPVPVAPKPAEPKPKTTKLHLMVKLTSDEQRAKGVELAEAISDGETLVNEKNSIAQKIKNNDAKIERLSGIVKNNQELREVTCLQIPNYTTMDMATYRTDTEPPALVSTRPLTFEEKQLQLDLMAEKEADKGETLAAPAAGKDGAVDV